MNKNMSKKKNNGKKFILIIFIFTILCVALMFVKYNKDIKEYDMKNTQRLEEKVWEKVHHNWPEPPDEEKIYIDDGFYYFKYKFDGKDFWIRASDDENKNGRTIFENIGNLSTPSEMIEDYRVMDITGKSDRMIYEYLRTMGNRLR